ncbi:phosphoribosylamine--glycine ligase [Candidatus Daviesbacteria bacterium]|nr:phosphoribosylamine--glycine ligase [Candidatus Daviesbacteria bacterium]
MSRPEQIFIVGNGAREHVIGWKLAQEQHQLYFAPGNAGTAQIGQSLDINPTDVEAITGVAVDKKMDLVVVGPELPLALGLVDSLTEAKIRAFGPTQAAARLESSKIFSAQFNYRHNIPQPLSSIFTDYTAAQKFIDENLPPTYVIKADGLASGKGVYLPKSTEEANQILVDLMLKGVLGEAGRKIVIQERLKGKEASIMAFTDGKTVVPMVSAKDYKRLLDNDEGPNTGGMGAIAPCPYVDNALMKQIQKSILQPAVNGMREEGHPFKGVLYAGIMITDQGPKVLEYNVRFGDPETQAVLRLLDSPLKRIFDACIDETLEPDLVSFTNNHAVCIVLAAKGYPEEARTVDEIYLPGWYNRTPIEIFRAGTNSGRVLSVTAIDPHPIVARAWANSGAEQIKFEGKQYRSDIGRT